MITTMFTKQTINKEFSCNLILYHQSLKLFIVNRGHYHKFDTKKLVIILVIFVE